MWKFTQQINNLESDWLLMKGIFNQGDVRSSRGILGRQKFQDPSKQAVLYTQGSCF